MTEMLQRRHDPQRRDGYDRKHDRNIKAAKTNRRADSTGNPEAGGRGGALDRILEAQNGPPPINPMPVIRPSTMRAIASGVSAVMDSAAWINPQLATATSGKVRSPALLSDFSLFQPIGNARR